MKLNSKEIEKIAKKAKDIVLSSIVETSEGAYLPMYDHRYELLNHGLYTTTQIQVKEGGADYIVAVECCVDEGMLNTTIKTRVVSIKKPVGVNSLRTGSTEG